MEKHAEYSLLYCKFIPGIGRVVPPLAGTLRMQPWRFVVFSVAGSVFLGPFLGGGGFIPAQQISAPQLAPRRLRGFVGVGRAGGVGEIFLSDCNRPPSRHAL